MHEFSGDLGSYRSVLTEDGSYSLYSSYFDEETHSRAGAQDETIQIYFEGCELKKLVEQFGRIHILEIGFGSGLATQLLAQYLPTHNYQLISTELDSALVKRALPNAKFGQENGVLIAEDQNCKVLIGDARKTLPLYFQNSPQWAHAIFQDAFSPRKNPFLWTYEWFCELKKVTHLKGILSTYCSSITMRKAMIQAGFILQEGGAFGRKLSTTKATLYGQTESSIIQRLERSPTVLLSDSNALEYKAQYKKQQN